MSTVNPVATSTCANVSIAGSHMPITPIAANMANVVTAGRTPLTTKAIAVTPSRVVSHGASTRNCISGWTSSTTMKFPERLREREHDRRRVLDVVEHCLNLARAAIPEPSRSPR